MDTFNMVDEVPFGADVSTMEIGEKIDDMDANACIEKIENWERFRKFWLDFYAKKIDEVNQKCDNNIMFQKRKLRDFFDTVPHRVTKTMEVYDNLPSGKITMTLPKRNMVPNKESILARLKKNGETEFIKVEEKLDWSGYKSRLFISDMGDVLDKETGEIVTDVAVEMSEADFSVKPNKKVSDEE